MDSITDSTTTILVVDDEPAHCEAIMRAFQPRSDVTIRLANSLAEFRSIVLACPPDLALVDMNLPDGRAVELLTTPMVQCRFPIVVMTSHGNEQTAVEAMKAGALDYVVKSSEVFADMPHIVDRALREWVLRQECKRADDELHAREQRYRTLFQSSHDALMTLAPPTWRFSSGNPAVIKMFGASDEADFISRGPWEFSPERQPDGRASYEKAIEMIESALRDDAMQFEWTHRRVTGEEFPATVLLTRIELNGLAQLQATVRDESEKKKFQASLAQADRLASMGMLAAGVAHEINNPLAYVRYNIESLTQDLPRLASATQRVCAALREQIGNDATAKLLGSDAAFVESESLADTVERAQEAHGGIERIVDITRGLGTFSRVDSSNAARTDVKVALEAALNMTANEIAHRARLVKDIGQLPAVWAADGKLSQVFLNVLINACHAIDEGDAGNNHIRVHAWSDKDAVWVEIADTGKGIAPEILERIFEPFFTTKAIGVGSGLGLSISKNILAEFKGSLSVASEVGKGSCFTVRLPVMSETQRDSTEVAVVDVPTVPIVHGRILIVDDEESIRRSLVRLLGLDHEVIAEASGKEAQERIVADSAFDLVLCDLMMAHMSGIEFHAWLSAHYPILGNRLVFFTGGAFTPKVSEYLASVGNLTIQKPFDSKSLPLRIAGLIRSARNLG